MERFFLSRARMCRACAIIYKRALRARANNHFEHLYVILYSRDSIIFVNVLRVVVKYKNAIAENQILTKKMLILHKILTKIFGQFTKKQYLCSRFAPEVSELQKWRKLH